MVDPEFASGQPRASQPLVHLRVPYMASTARLGLGDAVKRLLAHLGFRPCGACTRRAEALNRVLVLSGSRVLMGSAADVPRRRWRLRAPAEAVRDAGCWHFSGNCTGFGKRQCVSGPASQDPDAEIIEQCCGGWFQYPWIEVCPGQQATQGCGFCFW
jgi:hypothetical protein